MDVGSRGDRRHTGTVKRSQVPVRGGKFVNAYAEGDALYLFFRDEHGKLHRRIERAEHTCFLRADEVSRAVERELQNTSIVASIKRDGDYFRVRWNNRDALKRLARKDGLFAQKEIQTFEADVDPVRRWLTDNPEIQIAKPRRCYLDLEADSRVPFAHKHTARMLAWGVVDHETGAKKSAVLLADTNEAEREMLIALWEELAKYDQVIAWNGERFDFPYLAERTVQREINVEIRRWLWLDHMLLFRRMNVTSSESGEEKQSMALQKVAEVVAQRGKLKIDEDDLEELDEDKAAGAQSWEAWQRNPDWLRRYCEDDADLMLAIERKTGYVDILQAVCEACATFPDTRGINPTNQVEGFLMRLGAARGLRFRTHHYDDSTSQFKGAYVKDVVKGLHREEVHVCDFSGMYPSIIISWNMSPETLRPDIRLKEDASARPHYLVNVPLKEWPIPEGHCAAAITDKVFVNEPMGILPAALLEIRAQRKKWGDLKASLPPGTQEAKEADRRDTAYKQIANCFYGVISSPFSRFFERAVGESITQSGVWLIKHVEAEAEKRLGATVIAGDTDSLFAKGCTREQFKSFVDWCNAELFPKLLAERKAPRNAIKIAYEKAFRRVLFMVKKRYAGAWAHYKGSEATADSKPEIKGLEFKRGDSMRLARKLQEEVIYRLLGVKCEAVEKPEEMEPIVERYMRAVFDEPLQLPDIVQSKKLAKPIAEYVRKEKKAPPTHKLRGEEVHVVFSDHECTSCGASPSSDLSLRSGVCHECGESLKRRRSSAKGYVIQATTERIAVSDGRKTALIWTATIDTLVAMSSLPEHVAVARMLQLRGRDVGKGVRIEFVTLDADDPFGTVPAEDFVGEADRFHLWEKVWEPTERVLVAAFPHHPWSKYLRRKVTPVQVARAASVVKKQSAARIAANQRTLF